MNSFWNGTFAKHRDYEHDGNVAAHLRAAGGTTRVRDKVRVAVDPITEKDLPEPEDYAKVEVRLPESDVIYIYLIRLLKETLEELSDEEIDRQINEYVKNPVFGGRNIEDYIEITDENVLEDILDTIL